MCPAPSPGGGCGELDPCFCLEPGRVDDVRPKSILIVIEVNKIYPNCQSQ